MPIAPAANNINATPPANLPVDPAAQPVAQQPKAIPGFDPAGAPLGDADVWNLFVGKGASRRPVSTSDAHGKKKIDTQEQKALLELLTKSPKEFLTRLLADSMNGTPVELSITKEMKGFGVGHVSFKAENGHVDTTATVEVFNKAADGWLKSYMAKDARAKGTRSKIALEISGDLNQGAGIDNIKLEARVENFPKISAEKLQELEKLKKEMKAIFDGKGRTREKRAKAQDMLMRAVKNASDMPIGFLFGLITDNHELQMDFKEKNRSTNVHAETGAGKYALTFTDIMDGENKDEADLGAKLAGTVSEDKQTISLDEARVYTTDALSIAWGEDDKPILSRTDPQTGEKTKIDDHVGEIMMYLPMALALMGKRDIF